MSKTATAKYCCSYYNIKDQTVKEADAVVRNICVNAEWYYDNPRGNATEIFTPCDEDEDNAYVIEGKRYMITFSSPYAELKKLYEKSKNKQLSLFDY